MIVKNFKDLFLIGVIALSLIAVIIIQYAAPSRTVDFRGEILGIAVSEDGAVTLYATDDVTGDFLFRIDDETKIENCCGERITVENLSEGATVDINYRKYLFKDEKVHTAKSVKIYE